MEKNRTQDTNQKAKAPLADESNKLTPEEHNSLNKREEKETGKLPNDDFGTDHNSDPIIAKNQ